MKTAEEILEKYVMYDDGVGICEKDDAIKAMKEYASKNKIPFNMANQLLDIRDIILLEQVKERNEILHRIYCHLCVVVDPDLNKYNHWEELEKLTGR